MQKMLASQQDFINEKPLIQIVIEEAGHICWFLSKFYCELNPIEMYWDWVKVCESWEFSHTFSGTDVAITGFHLVVDGTFPTMKCLIPEILNDCPVRTIWAFFQKSWQYMDAYRYEIHKYICITISIIPNGLFFQERP